MKNMLLTVLSLFGAAKAPPADVCEALLAPHRVIAERFARFEDDDLLLILRAQYSELFTWLSQKSDVTAEGGSKASIGDYGPARIDSPSRFLFGRDVVEVDRTAVGILALKWLLAGEYDRFVSQQKSSSRLTRSSFAELASFARSVLKTNEDLDAMVVMILTNDLGKVRRYHQLTERAIERIIVDHDDLLFAGFNEWAETSPSFYRLPAEQRRKILAGLALGSKLNVGQLVQGENLPVNLEAVGSMAGRSADFDFKFLEMILDVAGARGHVDSRGAMVMTEPLYQNFKLAREALWGIVGGHSVRFAYDVILNAKARAVGWPELNEARPDRPLRAQLRLLALSRGGTARHAEMVAKVYRELPRAAQEILEDELNVDGTDDTPGMLPYYAPAFISNAIESLGEDRREEALRVTFLALSRAYQLVRRQTPGVFTVNFEDLATYVRPRADGSNPFAADPNSLMNHDFAVEPRPGEPSSFTLRLKVRRQIDPSGFKTVRTNEISDARALVIVGVGGGSDVIQAAQLAHVLRGEGKQIRALISYRRERTDAGEARGFTNVTPVNDHLARVTARTKGAGRVLEPLVADEFPTFLASLRPGADVGADARRTLEILRSELGAFDGVILVDTGGDCLYAAADATGLDATQTTPDQDLRVLRMFGDAHVPDVRFTVAVVAAGVDSPPDAEDVLRRARATYWDPSATETAAILNRYEGWNLTGRSESLYGKTPYAWQSALAGKTGTDVLPLPRAAVMDRANPWNPFARVPARGVFFMSLDDYFDPASK